MTTDAMYDVGATLHRALALRKQYHEFRAPPSLLYSALETRFCIEQTLFEYLGLLHADELSKQLRKLYRARNLREEILRVEPQFERKLDFFRAFLPFTPGYESAKMPTPDLDLLVRLYGQIGSYLHVQRPARDLAELDTALERAHVHLEEILSGVMTAIHLSPEGEALFDRYLRGELSDGQLRAELSRAFAKSPMKDA